MSFQTPKPKALNLTPATSVTSSLSSRSEPPSPVAFNLLSIYDVSVNPPESLPDQENPIFFTVTIRNNMTGAVWVIKRRYSAFDALKNELWWRRVATAVKIGLPPKVPPPGHNLKALRSRANGLEAWAAQVLQRAGDAAREGSSSRIEPHHIRVAVRRDDDLVQLVGEEALTQGGLLRPDSEEACQE